MVWFSLLISVLFKVSPKFSHYLDPIFILKEMTLSSCLKVDFLPSNVIFIGFGNRDRL